jgi:hypothetical protein
MPVAAQGNRSAFATVRFGEAVQVDLPRSWTYMDKGVSDHLNTSSEAVANLAGVNIAQGDNKILVAANAYDSQGKSKATLRISLRAAPGVTQAQMREFSTQAQSAIESQLRPSADETAKAMLKVPGVKSYSVRAVKLDQNDSLVCSCRASKPISRGRKSPYMGLPLGVSTLKLTTSYEKTSRAIYEATLVRVWRSLKAPATR